ncbi:stimulus-sensing domain-containing protein [Bosea thiooxidans]|uniref:histidine kinase n=1 Tax=Bosea thiooxidans TaxID=53254 RepID=A0A1T5H077_9HYPH|nr:stimulus-sensing domain-containing protein [Bosea thiooxidans]SKC14048.1 two-component system, OmpR family, sensor histidine kinase ChvG [Bosea thiooxidans]
MSSPAGWRGVLRRRVGLAWRRAARAVSLRAASSLTRRILVLNLGGLVALLLGFLYLNQFREGLIEARVQSLLTQGEIIAGAIASSATVEIDTITIDPDKLLQLQAGESAGIAEDPLDFSINPEKVAPLLRRLVTPTKTRARVYDKDGMLTLDSRSLYSRGDVLRLDLPRVGEPDEPPLLERTWNMLRNRLGKADVPTYDDFENANGKSYPEVARALNGSPASVVRVNTRGQTIVSVAVPVQRFRTVKGALLLSTQGGDIDAVIAAERFAIFQVFAVAAGVMIVLSVLLAGTIAEPIRKLADAAQRVRRGVKSREQIPDFSSRHDEIGHLSGTLRDMTKALYSRIEAIESFAADVAHELKNPLTSLRSAVETLPRAKSDESRGRLLSVIQHDVRRLDRLISDISDASRLDAELARNDSAPVDVAQVLEAVVTIQNETRPGQAKIELTSDRRSLRPGADSFLVMGHDSRIGQVLVNLIDNARSFSPPDKPVRVGISRVANDVLVTVEDEGPGIEPHALERIFERFYTDRPNEGFGQNSGLGLSISRQIVEAHRGSIRAENRLGPVGPDGEAPRIGARFIVCLPSAYPHVS